MVVELCSKTVLDYTLIQDVPAMVDKLLAAKNIVGRHKDYILDEKLATVRNKRLVLVLTRRSVADYKAFVENLKQTQSTLAKEFFIGGSFVQHVI